MTRFALAACAAALLTAPALAGDLPEAYVPPPLPEPVPAAPADFSGWYLRGDIGVGIQDFEEIDFIVDGEVFTGLTEIDQSLGDTVSIGAGVGYRFNEWFRLDVTGEYRKKAKFDSTYYVSLVPDAENGNTTTGDLHTVVGLVNAYADLGHYHGFSPFIGAGVGFAHHRIESLRDTAFGVYPCDAGFTCIPAGFSAEGDYESETNFAWALHAGVGYEINERLSLELAYRYLSMGDATTSDFDCVNFPCDFNAEIIDITSHDLRLGMRWQFGVEEAYLPPEPVVAKY